MTMNLLRAHMTKSEMAAQYIQEQILSGTARPGSSITTTAVSEALGMSETPVREAIKSLAAEGWLEHSAHRGTVVTSLNSAQIREIFILRGLLNAEAVRLGRAHFDAARLAALDENLAQSEEAVRANDFDRYATLNSAFHELLCNTPSTEWTWRLFGTLQGKSAMLRAGFRAVPDGLRKSFDAHLKVRAALACGDFEAAAEAVRIDEISAMEHLIEALAAEERKGAA